MVICSRFSKAICSLQTIFKLAHSGGLSSTEEKNLKDRLLRILECEAEGASESIYHSEAHDANIVVVTYTKILLLNIFGIRILLDDSSLFIEGELDIRNIQWIDQYDLLIFDLFYIVQSRSQRCVCRFSNSEKGYVQFSQVQDLRDRLVVRTEPIRKVRGFKYCLFCGEKLSEQSSSCPACGRDTQKGIDPENTLMMCNTCGNWFPPESIYCPYCNRKMR